MKLTYLNRTALAAGVFFLAGVAPAQTTTPPNQNGTYPNGSTSTNPTPGYVSGRGNTATGTVDTRNGATQDQSAGAPSTRAHAMDMRFAREAAIGGLAEVELGKLATQKASSDKVKQFGQKMVDDHSKANDELKSIAGKNGMTLPTALDGKHKSMIDKMSALSGDQFDQAYVKAMVKDHDKDVSEFQDESNNGNNPDLKNWAAKALPTLQEHDRMIREIKSGMGSAMTKK